MMHHCKAIPPTKVSRQFQCTSQQNPRRNLRVAVQFTVADSFSAIQPSQALVAPVAPMAVMTPGPSSLKPSVYIPGISAHPLPPRPASPSESLPPSEAITAALGTNQQPSSYDGYVDIPAHSHKSTRKGDIPLRMTPDELVVKRPRTEY